ncbi:hypothetical protein OH768_51860 [Streptomyces sp. NBC_01622]|uniref:hypothetical protein n=1 Tax=Streptomyces sp. NBC_01622 TaxID=2975903 RepID=UPI00386468CB|nr:hypothetical protein OH768_51860 [Streptomyces sp. NBC_01622]
MGDAYGAPGGRTTKDRSRGEAQRPSGEPERSCAEPQLLDEAFRTRVLANVGRTVLAHAVSLVKRFSDAFQ